MLTLIREITNISSLLGGGGRPQEGCMCKDLVCLCRQYGINSDARTQKFYGIFFSQKTSCLCKRDLHKEEPDVFLEDQMFVSTSNGAIIINFSER